METLRIRVSAKDTAGELAQTLVAGRIGFSFEAGLDYYRFHMPSIADIDAPAWINVLEDFKIQHYEPLNYRICDGG